MTESAIAANHYEEPSCTAEGEREQPVALTDRQKALVEKSWKFVEDTVGLQDGGIILFMRLFELCPEVRGMFKKFSDVPDADLKENEHLRFHALQVMETVAVAVSSLNETEELVEVLRELGGNHGSHDLQQAHFDLVGECLLWTLGQALGSQFTTEVKDAWTAVYGLVATEMKEGLQEYKEFNEES